jgi:hypothetical protein
MGGQRRGMESTPQYSIWTEDAVVYRAGALPPSAKLFHNI